MAAPTRTTEGHEEANMSGTLGVQSGVQSLGLGCLAWADTTKVTKIIQRIYGEEAVTHVVHAQRLKDTVVGKNEDGIVVQIGSVQLSGLHCKSFGGYAAASSAAGCLSQSSCCWKLCSFCSCRSIRASKPSRSAGVNFHSKGRAVWL